MFTDLNLSNPDDLAEFWKRVAAVNASPTCEQLHARPEAVVVQLTPLGREAALRAIP